MKYNIKRHIVLDLFEICVKKYVWFHESKIFYELLTFVSFRNILKVFTKQQ